MLISAFVFSVVVPVSVGTCKTLELIKKPYIVQAVIDSAQIAGLPASKAAKAYTQKIQMIDPLIQQIIYVSEPLSSRKLFFRKYFLSNDV